MAQVTHLFYLDRYNDNKINTSCGSNDPTDIATNSVTAVTCDECIEEMSTVKNLRPRPESTGKETMKEDPAIGEYAESCMLVVKEAETQRKAIREQRDLILRKIEVWAKQIQISLDTVDRLNDFLGEHKGQADEKVIR